MVFRNHRVALSQVPFVKCPVVSDAGGSCIARTTHASICCLVTLLQHLEVVAQPMLQYNLGSISRHGRHDQRIALLSLLPKTPS